MHIGGWPHYGARAVSFAAAVTVTWYGNRQLGVRSHEQTAFEYGAYFGVQAVGALINLGTYALIIAIFPGAGAGAPSSLCRSARPWLCCSTTRARAGGCSPQRGRGTGETHDEDSDRRRRAAPYTGVENLEVMREAENYNRYLLALVTQHAAGAKRVIDFGAGSGTFAVPCAAAGFDVTAVEPDERLRALLGGARIPAVAAVEALPDEAFEYAYTLNVLEHIPDDVAALRALRDKLVAGGNAYSSMCPRSPCSSPAWTPRFATSGGIHAQRCRPALQAAGFTIEKRWKLVDSLWLRRDAGFQGDRQRARRYQSKHAASLRSSRVSGELGARQGRCVAGSARICSRWRGGPRVGLGAPRCSENSTPEGVRRSASRLRAAAARETRRR